MTGYLFLLTFTSILLLITGAPSDERSGLSFVRVIVRPLLINIYRFTFQQNCRSCSFLNATTQPSHLNGRMPDCQQV
jgi:hypothetical protein